jgi:dTDP-4-dehydrorhamnose reductase
MSLKILLLGNTGQVGWELNRALLTLGELIAMDYPQIDMSDPDSIRSIVREHKPNLIINTTAYTNVDKAESETDLAMAINGTGPGILAEEAKRLKGALIHYSTDYVFDGTKREPYVEEDEPNPIDAYGETKRVGENAVQEVGGVYLIFRTSWVYSSRRPCFVTKVLKWAQEQETLRIVDDQISSPTWARTLAEATAQVISHSNNIILIDYLNEKSGIYHICDNGFCSRYDWAKSIIELGSQSYKISTKEIIPAKSKDFPTAAQRPTLSRLDCSKLNDSLNIYMPDWKMALQLMLKNN